MILASLLLGGFAAPAYATENIIWHGHANASGSSGASINSTEIGNIDVVMNGIDNGWNDTTAALTFSEKDFQVSGPVVSIINTTMDDGIDNNDALYAKDGANVEITGDTVYIATIGGKENRNGGAALAAKLGGGNNHITVSGKTVQLIGNLDFIGMNNGDGNTITAVLDGPDSFWYGDESNLPFDFGPLFKGDLNVTLENGAEWIYNANPVISSLILNKDGVVNLQDEDIDHIYKTTTINDGSSEYRLENYRNPASGHQYVSITNLQGTGGIFKTDIKWADSAENHYDSAYDMPSQMDSDYILIAKSESGTTQTLSFDASRANLEKMGADDKLYFATISDGKTQFRTEQSVYSNAANVFNYEYGASVKDNKYWYIGVTGKTAEDNANFTAAGALMDAGYAMGTELDTLNKRMGEARYLDDDQGLWVRYRHGRSSRDNSYETDSNMIQLGYDRKNDAESGTHHRGVAFDYTDADTSLYQLSSSGDVERYALSLYDTWMGNKGHYYDFVIRGGRLNSGYDIDELFSTGMEAMDNSYHQWFGSVSFEYGRKKDMSGSWYIEPQAQLQLARIGGASFTSASGVRTDMDGMTSLIGRAGFRLGRDFGNDENGRDTFYVKADILHEFAGDRGFTLTGNDGWYTRNDNGTDTWYDVGIGADLSLGRNTYFWADVERILGSDFDNTWQVSGGLRWEW